MHSPRCTLTVAILPAKGRHCAASAIGECSAAAHQVPPGTANNICHACRGATIRMTPAGARPFGHRRTRLSPEMNTSMPAALAAAHQARIVVIGGRVALGEALKLDSRSIRPGEH